MKSLLIPVLMTILVSCQQKIDLDAGILEGGETADYIRSLSDPGSVCEGTQCHFATEFPKPVND